MKKTLLAVLVALMLLAPAACGGGGAPPSATPNPKPAATRPLPPTSTAIPPAVAAAPTTKPSPTADLPPTIEAFEVAVEQAVVERNPGMMASLMGDPFTIAFWESEGNGLGPADAAQQLAASYLATNAVLTFDKPAAAELTKILKGTDPRMIWGPGVKVVSVILSQGWGLDGRRIAFLILAQRADGRFYWHGVLFAGASLLAPPPAPTAMSRLAPAGLAITSFTCTLDNLGTGKRATFTWTTTGATEATIVCQTSSRFPVTRQVPPNGTTTIDLPETYYPNPAVILVAGDGQRTTKKELNVNWLCRYGYFFPNGPGCPAGDPTTSQAAQQPFQNGRMVWLKEIRNGSTVTPNQIIVLYNDGRWAQFDDTWQEGQPEVDTSINAPAGLVQPKRGFGKQWRSNADVRNKLGWATAEEKAYAATWQWMMVEALPSVAFLRTMDNQTIQLSGQRDGTWKALP